MSNSDASVVAVMDTPTANVPSGLNVPSGIDVPSGLNVPFIRHRATVVAVSSVVVVAAFAAYPVGLKAFLAAFLSIVLVLVSATDLERRIIPNKIIFPAIIVTLVAEAALSPAGVPQHVLAMLAAGVFMLLPNLVNPSAVGMGDVKLAALLGAALGWKALDALALAFVLMAPLSFGTLVRGGLGARKVAIPMGPFMAAGGIAFLIIPQLLGMGGA